VSSATSASIILGLTTSIGELSRACNKLERSLAKLGTPGDNSHFRDVMHDDQISSSAHVKQLLSSLQEAKPLLDATQFTRLSLQLDAQYKRYQKLQQQIDAKQKTLLAQHSHGAYDADDDARTRLQSNGHGRQEYGTTGQHQQQQQQQVQEEEEDVQFTEWEHEEVVRRVEEIKQIEGEVAEVAELYRDLHLMVNEQQEGIDIVTDNIETVKVKTEEAQEQLESAAGHQKKARTKKCCIGLAVIIAVAVAIVLVIVLHK
jgi:t-SNARE complex subunit (syntaxin)